MVCSASLNNHLQLGIVWGFLHQNLDTGMGTITKPLVFPYLYVVNIVTKIFVDADVAYLENLEIKSHHRAAPGIVYRPRDSYMRGRNCDRSRLKL